MIDLMDELKTEEERQLFLDKYLPTNVKHLAIETLIPDFPNFLNISSFFNLVLE